MKSNVGKYDVFEIAKWLLDKEPMTHKRLQKYLYFIYSEYLVLNNKCIDNIENRLFTNDFEAWIHGPVSPTVYNNLKGSGYNIIGLNGTYSCNIENCDEEIIKSIYEKYKNISTYQLELLSHQEPWIKTRGNISSDEICKEKIDDKMIYAFFSGILNGKACS